MDFPSIGRALIEAGIEGYGVDYRRGTATYFLPGGESVELITPKTEGAVAAEFKANAVEQAVREAQANAAAVKSFRDAVMEGAAFMLQPKNEPQVRAAIGKYIKLPPETLAKMQISPPGPTVSEKQLNYWVGLMKEQGMLQTEPKVATLLVK